MMRAQPSTPTYRNDTAVFVGESIDFLGPGVQTVLVGHDQQRGHLRIGYLALEGGLFQGAQQLLAITQIETLRKLSGQRGKCSAHVLLHEKSRPRRLCGFGVACYAASFVMQATRWSTCASAQPQKTG